MEKIITQSTESKSYNENLFLKDRKNITLDGIIEIISYSDTSICAKIKDNHLIISGTNITITKLDIEKGVLEANGLFESIKYGKKINIFKRFFK